jgi:N-acetyl sugar amidotransferase
MALIPAPQSVDKSRFEHDDPTEAKYGLPRYVAFCKHCVISNQRPNSAVEFKHTAASKKATINFDDEGVCDACRFAERKHGVIDWAEREAMLAELCDKFRSKSKYDCLVPGSGGKDSFYASHYLRTRFNMHPLTVTWAPHIYTEWGWRNFQSWIHAGHDNQLMTPNGRAHRLLTRLAVDKLFHPFQAFMLGQKSLAPKMALLHDIPFVVYGENEAEYGNPISDTGTAKRDCKACWMTSAWTSKTYCPTCLLIPQRSNASKSRFTTSATT